MKYKNITACVCWLTIILFVGQCFAVMDQTSMEETFRKANHAFRLANESTDSQYRREQYQLAILHYEKLIHDGGIENAMLYYNLANAYLLSDRIGKAIVNYRRAESIDPGNHDIQKNLKFARFKRLDKVDIQTEKQILQTLFFWHFTLAINTRFFLVCLSFGLMLLSLAGWVLFGRQGWLITTSLILVLLTVSLFISVTIEQVHLSTHHFGVITDNEVIVRQGDGSNYGPSFKEPLHDGTEFEVLEIRSGWIHIRLADGSEGWVEDDSVDLI